jgi:hypothetical protein
MTASKDLDRRHVATGKRIQQALRRHLGPGDGAIVLAFNVEGPEKRLSYVASCDRESCITTLLEWIETQDPAMVSAARERLKNQQVFGPGAERSH